MAAGIQVQPLVARIEELEAASFVGRVAQLDDIGRAIAGEQNSRIFHVHGPGGVGKSALLRAVERRAKDRGHHVARLDGRTIVADAAVLEAWFHAACRSTTEPPSVIVIDERGAFAPLRVELIAQLMGAVPCTTVVVTADRHPPEREWFEHGLDRLTSTVGLSPLDSAACKEFLERSGVADPDEVAAIATWSCGFPIALVLAASLWSGEDSHSAGPLVGAASGARLDERLLERLGSSELAGIDADVLDVAAIAPAVDARLLSAVLPGRPTRASLAALRACRLSEPVGSSVTLHRLARSALRTRLAEAAPHRYRDLVLRVAAYLRSRAEFDGIDVIMALASLIENPDVQLSLQPSTTHYSDRLRDGDIETVAAATGRGAAPWFGRMETWARVRPSQLIAVRRFNRGLSALAIAYSGTDLPDWALEWIEVGPVVEHARRSGHLDQSVFLQDVTIIESPAGEEAVGEIMRVGNAALLAVFGMKNGRFAYVTGIRDEMPNLDALGYVEIPELRRGDDDRELMTIVCDFGEDGVVGRFYDMVCIEQLGAPVEAPRLRTWLIDALRSFHDDAALERIAAAASVSDIRETVRRALDAAFGESPEDQLARCALERTYLDIDGGNSVAQHELFMSRSSYFRLLQRARRQLVEQGGSLD